MKKPNITESPWKINLGPTMTTYRHLAWLGERLEITANEPISAEEHRANAKAISAVPEMIDALIYVYNFELNTNSLDPETLLKVTKALKKAGVEL